MTFNITDTEFAIIKTKKERVRDWIIFVLGIIVVYWMFFLLFYIWGVPVKVEYVVLLIIICFGTMFLLNRRLLRPCTIEIKRINDRYSFGNKYSFNAHEEKRIRVYDRFGDLTIGVIGNMYLKIGSKQFLLSYGVSENEMDEIKKNLELFFSEELIVEYKTKYW